MPQMMPMLWLILFIYFIIIFILFMIKNFFMVKYSNLKLLKKNYLNNNIFIWKW
uniref:ATP synthase complex subunit 8 n=2 Tax=Ctenocephalides felis TaxID=7515 RepID=A0A8F4WG77_CTEFE|nr:ATP synthase F0 subunit 8 [Ctenocephalides felis]QLI54050.1 ATP synthase F0 subunit 8 [Ctenocephalides felis]QXG83120.1 ATP synthase F0 subunit 8 [Ctenocephalides felis felis]